MKKRSVLTVLLALVLALGLCACGGDTGGKGGSSKITCTEAQAAEKFGAVLKAFDAADKSTLTITSVREITVKQDGEDDVTQKAVDKSVSHYDGTANKLIVETFSSGESNGTELTLGSRKAFVKSGDNYTESRMRYEEGEIVKENSYKQTLSDAYFKTMKRYVLHDETAMILIGIMSTVSHAGAVSENGKLTFDGKLDWDSDLAAGLGEIGAKVDMDENGTGTYTLSMAGEQTQNGITRVQTQTVEMKFENTVTMPEAEIPSDLNENSSPDEDCDMILNPIYLGEMFAGNFKMTDGTATTEFEIFGDVSVTKVAAATVYEIYNAENRKSYTYYDFTDTNKGKVYYEDYFSDAEDLGEYPEIDAYEEYVYEGTLAFEEGKLTLTNDEATVTLTLDSLGFPLELKCNVKAVGSTPAATYTLTFSKKHTMSAPTDEYLAQFTLKTVED